MIQRGDAQLQIEFDFETRLATISQSLLVPGRAATIQKKEIELRDQNVLLVDAVDDAKGLQVAGMLRIDPALPADSSPSWVGEALRRSPELVSFLRCDTRMTDPQVQRMADIVCASVLGQ